MILFTVSVVIANEINLCAYRALELISNTTSSLNLFSLVGDFISYSDNYFDDKEISLSAKSLADGYPFDVELTGYKNDTLQGENYRQLVSRTGLLYFMEGAGVRYFSLEESINITSISILYFIFCYLELLRKQRIHLNGR